MTKHIPKRIYFTAGGCLVFIIFFTIFGDKGVLNLYGLQQEKNDINARLSAEKAEKEKLRREMISLKSDRNYLENIARKDFGLVRGNETVYQFR